MQSGLGVTACGSSAVRFFNHQLLNHNKNMEAYDQTEYEHAGHTIRIQWHFDQDTGAPWEEHDGHGPVSDWTRRDRLPGERLLHSDHGSKRFYDYAEAIKIAKRDGWDAKPYKTDTKGEQAARAVEADFQWLRSWCNDGWHWCGYTVEIDGMKYDESLWGIDSDSQAEFEKEAVQTAKDWLDTELAESFDAACRDLVTA